MVRFMSERDWVDSFAAAMKIAYPELSKLEVYRNRTVGHVVISAIVVAPEHRGVGVGTQVVKYLITNADAHGSTLACTPSPDFGGSVGRLRAWYRRLGFVFNQGRQRDYAISESMYRLPDPSKFSR